METASGTATTTQTTTECLQELIMDAFNKDEAILRSINDGQGLAKFEVKLIMKKEKMTKEIQKYEMQYIKLHGKAPSLSDVGEGVRAQVNILKIIRKIEKIIKKM